MTGATSPQTDRPVAKRRIARNRSRRRKTRTGRAAAAGREQQVVMNPSRARGLAIIGRVGDRDRPSFARRSRADAPRRNRAACRERGAQARGNGAHPVRDRLLNSRLPGTAPDRLAKAGRSAIADTAINANARARDGFITTCCSRPAAAARPVSGFPAPTFACARFAVLRPVDPSEGLCRLSPRLTPLREVEGGRSARASPRRARRTRDRASSRESNGRSWRAVIHRFTRLAPTWAGPSVLPEAGIRVQSKLPISTRPRRLASLDSPARTPSHPQPSPPLRPRQSSPHQ